MSDQGLGYHHFRCATHSVPGSYQESKEATYPCGVRGCERPAKAYWYRGSEFKHLEPPAPPNYGDYG